MASQSTKPAPQRVTFSRPFSDLLVELSIALQKFVMYPDGHPLLDPAAAAVVRRAERIMEDRPSIAFGVARHQLIIEGVATDPKQPVLRRLADNLNRHHLGAISLSRGVTPTEIAEALRQVGAETNTVVPIGLRPLHELPSWPHVRLHPLTFDRLALVTDTSRALDMPDGDYVFGPSNGGERILRRDGVGIMPDGLALASGVMGMDHMVRTFHFLTGISLVETVRMASLTPARIAQRDKHLGSIETGVPTGNLAWGEDGSSLFITSNTNVFRIKLTTKGAGF